MIQQMAPTIFTFRPCNYRIPIQTKYIRKWKINLIEYLGKIIYKAFIGCKTYKWKGPYFWKGTLPDDFFIGLFLILLSLTLQGFPNVLEFLHVSYQLRMWWKFSYTWWVFQTSFKLNAKFRNNHGDVFLYIEFWKYFRNIEHKHLSYFLRASTFERLLASHLYCHVNVGFHDCDFNFRYYSFFTMIKTYEALYF